MRLLLALLVVLALATHVAATSRLSALDLFERRVAASKEARDVHFASLAETNARVHAQAQARVHAAVEAEAGVQAKAAAAAKAEAEAEAAALLEAQVEEDAENEAIAEVTQEQEVEDLAARHMLLRLQQQVIAQAQNELHRREVNLMETSSRQVPHKTAVHSIAHQINKNALEKQTALNQQTQTMHNNFRSLLMKKAHIQQQQQQQQQKKKSKSTKPHTVSHEVVLDGWPAKAASPAVQKEMNKVVDHIMAQDVKPEMTIRQKVLDDARRVNSLAEHTHKDYKNWQEDVKEMKLLPHKSQLI